MCGEWDKPARNVGVVDNMVKFALTLFELLFTGELEHELTCLLGPQIE